MFKAISQFFKKDKKVEPLPESQEKEIEVAPQYQKWRDVVFKATAEQVGLSKDDPERVYGVIMDVGLANDDGAPGDKNLVITETAFASGESSLQTSFGGGIIGLGSNEEISKQVQEIVRLAQLLINTTTPANNQDLPESGKVYFYLLTTSGIKFYECSLREVQVEEHPFGELFTRFSVIKGRADQLMVQSSKKSAARIKTLYILTFTPEKVGGEMLQDVAFSAANMLVAKDAAFKQLMDSLSGTKIPIEIANLEYNRMMHSPQAMQSSMGGWLKNKFNLAFKPNMGENFFPHGMRNQAGQENFILFYFDFEE